MAHAPATSKFAASLGGMLLLLSAPGRTQAAVLAGGAVLLPMPDAVPAKAALRAGYCNFLVSDLDEAVRILRNEIRRGAAVSVGLLASLADVEGACVERGLQPDLLEREEPMLEARGAHVVDWQQTLAEGEQLVVWSALGGAFSSLQTLRGFAQQCVAKGDVQRRRWLAQAHVVLGRQPQGSVPMYEGEITCLLAALDREPVAPGCIVSAGGGQIWPRMRARD